MTEDELFKDFSSCAGNMGTDIHTRDGIKPMYSIYHNGALIYATCTRMLYEAYRDAHFKAEDGTYWLTEQKYRVSKFATDPIAA